MSGPLGVPFPSGRPDPDKVNRALAFLKDHGVSTHCPLLSQEQRWNSDPSYLCGSDQERIEELLEMWASPELTRIWCGRGGYGATRLLSFLQRDMSANVPPTRFLGYSDITALFAFLYDRGLPIECIHAPVLTELPDHPQPELLFDALEGRPCPLPVKGGVAFEGPIWGGNLAVLASLAGTAWLPQVQRGAVFLEDIDEAPYRLDRFVTQLHDSGFFRRVEGVFLGQFTKCGKGDAGLEAVKQRLRELSVPILGELPVGHEAFHLPLFLNRVYSYAPASGTLEPQAERAEPSIVRTAWHGAKDRG